MEDGMIALISLVMGPSIGLASLIAMIKTQNSEKAQRINSLCSQIRSEVIIRSPCAWRKFSQLEEEFCMKIPIELIDARQALEELEKTSNSTNEEKSLLAYKSLLAALDVCEKIAVKMKKKWR